MYIQFAFSLVIVLLKIETMHVSIHGSLTYMFIYIHYRCTYYIAHVYVYVHYTVVAITYIHTYYTYYTYLHNRLLVIVVMKKYKGFPCWHCTQIRTYCQLYHQLWNHYFTSNTYDTDVNNLQLHICVLIYSVYIILFTIV